jgi:putative PIN family toxin of toxin-antitoxin system
MQKKFYVVVDTNIFISGLLKIDSYPGLILQEVLKENITLLINQEIFDEYREVMRYLKVISQ